MWPRFFFFLFRLCSCLDARLQNVRCGWISWSAGKTSWSVPCHHKTSNNRVNALRPPENNWIHTAQFLDCISPVVYHHSFFPPKWRKQSFACNESVRKQEVPRDNLFFEGSLNPAAAVCLLPQSCLIRNNFIQTLIWIFFLWKDSEKCSLFTPWKTLNLHCVFVINQPFAEFMCLHKQTEEEKKKRERKQILQTWTSRGKRGLLEEKQKCLRTFLCDYTVPDKSRHSCSHFVFWALN